MSDAAQAITPGNVRDALRAVRYAKPMRDLPLVQLDLVGLRLRQEGVADSRATREWMLGNVLDTTIRQELGRQRGQEQPVDHASDTEELATVLEDFQAGSIEREAWSMLLARYMGSARVPSKELAERLAVVPRTLERRLNRGHRLLANVLREAEVEASQALRVHAGAPAHARILVAADVEAESQAEQERAPEDVLRSLLRTVRSDEEVVQLAGREATAIARHPVADLVEYRLGRIAAWSRPRYRLDERFVALTLLVDKGEQAIGGRWSATGESYGDLRDLAEAADSPVLTLLGPPGGGKSTLLRRYELDAAVDGLRETGGPLTFLASLGGFGDGAEEPPEPGVWLATRWAERFPAMPPLAEVMAERPMVLLLDALNEMPSPDTATYRQRVRLWKGYVQALVAELPDVRVIFSCRSLDYSAPLSSPELRVPQVRIEPLSDDQVRRFLRRYAPGMAQDLWRRLEGSRQLEVARIPYFLRLLVDHAAETGTIARGRAGLFTGFVWHALRREIARDGPLFQPGELLDERDYTRLVSARSGRTPWELPERGRLVPRMTRLADRMQRRRPGGDGAQVRVRWERALGLLEDPRAEDLLAAGQALAVLDEDRQRDEVMFFHQLLQEYFAARGLARQPEPSLVVTRWRAGEAQPPLQETLDDLAPADPLPPLASTGWEETMVMAMVMAEEPAALVSQLADANLPLAGRAAAEDELGPRLPVQLRQDLGRALVARAVDPGADPRARLAAGRALGELGDPRLQEHEGPDGRCLLPPVAHVTAGGYPMGDDAVYESMGEVVDGHRPAHHVELDAFEIACFAVTNAEWSCFMEAGGYGDERWWDTEAARAWRRGETATGLRADLSWFRERYSEDPDLLEAAYATGAYDEEMLRRWRAMIALSDEEWQAELRRLRPGGRHTAPRRWGQSAFNHPAQPVTCISWYEARAYARWLAAQTGMPWRLPTEAEWEAAARGAEGRRCPWGDGEDPMAANTTEAHVRGPSPVATFPTDATPLGIHDLGGNTSDWTSSAWGADREASEFPYPYAPDDGREEPDRPPIVRRIVRGGAWNVDRGFSVAWRRQQVLPEGNNYYFGLRLARDVTS